MERPIAFAGFSFLAGLLVVFFLSPVLSLVFFGVSLVIFVIAALKRCKNPPLKISCCAFLFAIILGLAVNAYYQSSFDSLGGKSFKIEGIVRESLEDSCRVEVTRVQNEEKRLTLLLYTPQFAEVYENQKIATWVKFYESREVKGFIGDGRLRAQGYDMRGTVKSGGNIEILGEEKAGFDGFLLKIKRSCAKAVYSLYSDSTRGVAAAMILGNEEFLRDEDDEAFRLSGASHILVVSGMHLSVMAGFLMLLLRRAPKKLTVIIAILAVIMYMLLTGMGKSVLRSGIMYILMLLAMLLGEETDSMNSLGLSVLLICLVSPYSAVDLGFILSVSATAGIILFSKKLTPKNLPKRLKPVWAAVAVSFGAFLLSFPVLTFVFGSINPLSVITSVVLAVPSSAVLVLGLVSVLLHFVFPPLGAAAAWICGIGVDFMLWFTNLMAVPGSGLPVLYGDFGKILFICIGVVTVIAIVKKPRVQAVIAYSAVVVMLTFAAFSASIRELNAGTVLVVEDSGRGMEAFLAKGEDAFVLSSNSKALPKSLEARGIKNIDGICTESPMVINSLSPQTKVYSKKEYGRSAVASFNEWEIQIELGGDLIIASSGEKSVVIEKRRMDTKIKTDILLSEFGDTKIDSDFTIMWPDDTINVNKKLLPVSQAAYGINVSGELELWREE